MGSSGPPDHDRGAYALGQRPDEDGLLVGVGAPPWIRDMLWAGDIMAE
jgi:hypothetical protein